MAPKNIPSGDLGDFIRKNMKKSENPDEGLYLARPKNQGLYLTSTPVKCAKDPSPENPEPLMRPSDRARASRQSKSARTIPEFVPGKENSTSYCWPSGFFGKTSSWETEALSPKIRSLSQHGKGKWCTEKTKIRKLGS